MGMKECEPLQPAPKLLLSAFWPDGTPIVLACSPLRICLWGSQDQIYRGVKLLESVIEESWKVLFTNADQVQVQEQRGGEGFYEHKADDDPSTTLTRHRTVCSWEHRTVDWQSVSEYVMLQGNFDAKMWYLPSEVVKPSSQHTGSFELAWAVYGLDDPAAVRRTERMVKVFTALPVSVLLERYPQIRMRSDLCLLPLRSEPDSHEPARFECHLDSPFGSLLYEVGPGPSEATEMLLGSTDPYALPPLRARFDCTSLLTHWKVSLI